MTDMVPYVKLTKKQEEKCLTMLVQGNVMLKEWATYLGDRKARDFRKMLFKGARDKAVMAKLEESIPADQLDTFRNERQFILAVHMTEYPDLNNRTVEYAMLCGFSSLARKHASRWFAQNAEGTSGMALSDYLNEAYIALLDAVYGYTDDNIMFTSFAWAALHNRMIYVTNGTNPLCPLTNTDLNLLAKFEETRKSFNERVTFDQVAAAMGLDDEQYQTLSKITTKVYTESQMTHKHLSAGNDDVPNDYTALRTVDPNDDRVETIVSVRDAIERAELNDFERTVLETSMNPYYGWLADVARKSVNLNTHQPYTRAWAMMALKNAQEKVKNALLRKKVA